MLIILSIICPALRLAFELSLDRVKWSIALLKVSSSVFLTAGK